MATLLDSGLLNFFGGAFPFLLVFVLMYAVLSQVKIFKDNQAYATLTALALAFMTLMFPIAQEVINMMGPWFVVIIIFVVLLMVVFQSFGIEDKSVLEVITGKTRGEYGNTIAMWIITISIIILLGSIFTVVTRHQGTPIQDWKVADATGGGGDTSTFFGILTHPKVLGILLLFLITFFAVKTISERWEKS